MLHELLLSLSGHPSPLLHPPPPDGHGSSPLLSPPERALLASLAHLSTLHINLSHAASHAAASHPSPICRAVAAAVEGTHLAAFRRHVLAVEATILRGDAALVGAHGIVPLTAVVREFDGWARVLAWLWEEVMVGGVAREGCTGAMTGYGDVEAAARGLVGAAEGAWLRMVSAWVVGGKVPGFGAGDFFEFVCVGGLLPEFVTPATAASMLFIGRSLNQIRVKSAEDPSLRGTDHLFTQLRKLAALEHPLDSATFSRTVTEIRHHLSRTVLRKLLPPAKVLETLQLLRDFFLLRRGEFAMALTQQADEKIRSRWRRAENLAYEKRDGLANVVVKDGEVAAVLARTWAAMGSMQGEHAEEDEGLELARDLLRLTVVSKSRSSTADGGGLASIASTPFRNLLFSVPVVLTLQIPSPLDLFLSQSDLATYTTINSYLLSLRRAHIRLTDLWKITPLRRHHPAPPPCGPTGRATVRLLRHRHTLRSNILRNAWATASAAIFFLGETEGYLQTEVVAGLTEDLHAWLAPPESPPPGEQEEEDIWLAENKEEEDHAPHDPQSLAAAHRRYLKTLVRRLLLTNVAFTQPLYELLATIDHLVALVRRLQAVWVAADLEADVGVVDAFVDLAREERDVRGELGEVEGRVKRGVEGLVGVLRGTGSSMASVNASVETPKEIDGCDDIATRGDAGESGSGNAANNTRQSCTTMLDVSLISNPL
ncbi:gamma-tubulin complex component protein [Schizothecium vesticola]|uniref:Spindle pole body component n=1 Tax=Schizothecium vesticola TaxID=314040 RepID=A0AA40K2V9_9PEZI|nr:gamma-tubulin complex component protein [Schizothecium vesticola]